MNKTLVRKCFCFLGAVVIPLLMTWAYLHVSRARSLTTDSSDYIALGACLIVGLASIAALPIQSMARVILSVLYIPVFSTVLFFFSLAYVCIQFNVCL